MCSASCTSVTDVRRRRDERLCPLDRDLEQPNRRQLHDALGAREGLEPRTVR